MNLIPVRKQSSEEWQEGVREENRFRKLELKIEELEQRIWWFYILVAGIIVLVVGLMFRH